MNKKYTTKTAALNAVVADIHKVSSDVLTVDKQLDAKNINTSTLKVGGIDINDLAGLKIPEDLPKLVTRCELPKDKPWALYDDNGCIIYINFADKLKYGASLFYRSKLSKWNIDFDQLIYGTNMFNQSTILQSFTGNLSKLTNGYAMFSGCNKLTEFKSNLESLTNGCRMFEGCKLDLASLVNIADTIKDVSELTNTSSWWPSNSDVYKQINIDLENDSIKDSSDGQQAISKLKSKGWTVYINNSKM